MSQKYIVELVSTLVSTFSHERKSKLRFTFGYPPTRYFVTLYSAIQTYSRFRSKDLKTLSDSILSTQILSQLTLLLLTLSELNTISIQVGFRIYTRLDARTVKTHKNSLICTVCSVLTNVQNFLRQIFRSTVKLRPCLLLVPEEMRFLLLLYSRILDFHTE